MGDSAPAELLSGEINITLKANFAAEADFNRNADDLSEAEPPTYYSSGTD